MSLRRKIALAAFAVLVAGLAAFALRSAVHEVRLARLMEQMRTAETSYHAALANTLAVSSEGVGTDGRMAVAFTCRGAEKSPPIAWKNAPPGTQSFVAMMVDLDASTPRPRVWAFTHWILYNIPLTETSIAAGAADAGLRQKGIEAGENSLGGHAYFGPCAPTEHRYLIRVYALDLPQIRPQTIDRQGINDAMKGHILSCGELAIHAGP